MPRVRQAVSTSDSWLPTSELFGFTSIAIRVAKGTSSCSRPKRFASTVDRRRSDAEHSQSNSDRWIPLGSVKAASREQADTPAVLAHDQAIAVVLDFMNPLPAAGRLRRERRITGLDEAGRQPHRPTRGTPLHARAIATERHSSQQAVGGRYTRRSTVPDVSL
jgi:hypothetical protein